MGLYNRGVIGVTALLIVIAMLVAFVTSIDTAQEVVECVQVQE